MCRTVIILALISIGYAMKLPSNFQKCNRKQPDLKECILKAAQHGIPQLAQPIKELNLPSISPFLVETLIVPGKGAVAVEQRFKNCKLFGFPDMKLDRFEFDFDKKTLDMDVVIPELRKLCEYELDGKVLLLPIKGTGPSTITFKNIHATVHFTYEEYKKKQKTFLKFVSSDVTLEPESMTYNFENLLMTEGADLGKGINQVLNDNWKEVFDEVKDGYIEVVKAILLSMCNNFFSRVSLEDALD